MSTNVKIILIISALIIATSFLVQLIVSNLKIEVSTYVVSTERVPEGLDGFRIVQISDLHNAEFGKDNEKLIALLEEAEPDIIVISGDMIDSRNTNVKVALELAEAMVDITPCYYVNGNHEARLSEYADLGDGLTALGVVVLEDSSVTVEHDGEIFTVVGVSDPSFKVDYLTDDEESVMRQTLDELADTDGFTVLLSHRPELFELYAEYGFDLVFSGHAHGGQFRLPFIGGLYAPGQGLLPEYDAGVFTSAGTNMIVSRGIGKSVVPMRINNSPEIVVVELKTEVKNATY
jgi:predicted MPP superfamily phosphohydrolase